MEQGERAALHARLPERRHLRASPDFPAVSTGAGGDAGTLADRYVFQIKDDVSLLKGNHQLKMGVNFNRLYNLGILNGNEHYATLFFFDDPSVILNNTNGRYPQGFQTPGIVRQWQQANGGAVNGQDTGRIRSTPRTSFRRGSRTTGARRRN